MDGKSASKSLRVIAFQTRRISWPATRCVSTNAVSLSPTVAPSVIRAVKPSEVAVNGDLDPSGRSHQLDHRQESPNLADILEGVLDKGIVIAGDIQVNLLETENLT